MDPATRRLLDGPIAPTLLRLAAPNVIMLVAQVAISVLEAYYVGWLGTDALAGVSVTFPLIMLMQTMSAGGMGGGVASAVARALGGGPPAPAPPPGPPPPPIPPGPGRAVHPAPLPRRRRLLPAL